MVGRSVGAVDLRSTVFVLDGIVGLAVLLLQNLAELLLQFFTAGFGHG